MADINQLVNRAEEFMVKAPYLPLGLAKEMIAALKEQPKWISVEDRLPEKGEVVLAFGIRSASTGQFQGVGAKPWFWYWKGNTIRRVTHWMPLSELPKDDEVG